MTDSHGWWVRDCVLLERLDDNYISMSVCVCVCVCLWVSVCVYVRGRERERETETVSVCERKSVGLNLCVYSPVYSSLPHSATFQEWSTKSFFNPRDIYLSHSCYFPSSLLEKFKTFRILMRLMSVFVCLFGFIAHQPL